MIALLVASVLALASPAPKSAPIITLDGGPVTTPQAPDSKLVAEPALRASLEYASRVCHAAKLGGLVNARVMDTGNPGEPLPSPLGPWHIICQRGTLEIAWKLVK